MVAQYGRSIRELNKALKQKYGRNLEDLVTDLNRNLVPDGRGDQSESAAVETATPLAEGGAGREGGGARVVCGPTETDGEGKRGDGGEREYDEARYERLFREVRTNEIHELRVLAELDAGDLEARTRLASVLRLHGCTSEVR